MKIVLAENSGFCFGVRRAYEAALDEASNKTKRIYTVGHLIHNDGVIAQLEENGVHSIDEGDLDAFLDKADKDTVFLIRAHGATVETQKKLEEAASRTGCAIVDCTCPYVKKIHDIVDKNTDDDTLTFIYGNGSHPEVAGIASHVKGQTLIYTSEEEISSAFDSGALPNGDARVISVAQTTQNAENYKKFKKIIKNLYTNSFFFDTICNVTESRQAETERLARKCDMMLIVGDKKSSNTAKLFKISKALCDKTYLIESPSDVPQINNTQTPIMIGVAAGASSPDCLIKEVINTMSEQENFAKLLEESFKTLNTGDTVTGIVTYVSNTEVKLDLGTKCTGVLTLENVTDDPSAKLEELFKLGDEVTAVAVRVSDVEGIAVLSKKKSDASLKWEKVKSALESGEVLEGKVVEAVKGGVVISALSQKIFIPASQTTVPKDGDLSELVGTVQKFKIIDIKEDRRRAVGSIRVVAREEKRALENAFWDSIEEGKHYEGVVKSLTPYGAFVDLGGVDGMVHTSELSWLRISKPSDVVSVGDKLDVFVKSFDREKGRISLGYKTEDTNPWKIFSEQYNVGDVVSVKIVSLLPFGAFAQIIPGVDGLIHISQIANKKLASPAEVLKKGETVDAKITEIDSESKKISLSIRALLPEEEAPADEAPADEAPADEAPADEAPAEDAPAEAADAE